jgi:polysaccharide biosynthesis transport protein
MDNNPEKQFGLRENLETMFRYKEKILWVFCVTLAVATSGAFLQSKVWEAGARVLVQQSRQQARVGPALTPNAAVLSERDQLRTEVQIFLSPTVLNGLVNKLGAQVVLDRMHWRWDWLRELPGNLWSRLKGSIIEPEAPAPPLDQLAADNIRTHLEVEPVRESDVFAVTFQAPDPKFAALVVNTLLSLYLEHHLAVRQSVVSNTVFAEEAERLTGDLRAAEDKLQSYKQRYGIVSSGAQKQLLLQRLSESEAALSHSEVEVAEADQRIAEIRRQLAQQSERVPQSTTSTPNPLRANLDGQLAQLQLERAQYVGGSPTARQLDEQIASVRRQAKAEEGKMADSRVTGVNQTYQELQKTLLQEEGRRRGLESRVQLREQAAYYRRELADLDREELELRELQRAVDLKEEALRVYQRKQEEVRVSAMLDRKGIGNVTPIEQAQAPIRPVRPRKLMTIISGVIAGLLGGLGLAYLSEFLRRDFANRAETERSLRRPVLAAMLDTRQASAAAINMVEARHLAEAVLHAHRRDGLNTVLLASAGCGEGKTYIAHALADGLVNQGMRVLLVDTRQRAPLAVDSLSKLGSEQCVFRETAHPLLTHLCLAQASGATNSPLVRYEQLMRQLDEVQGRFQLVVLDGPAVGSEPEGLWLASAVGYVLLVVEADRTPGLTAAQALKLLEGSGGRTLGVVLNKRRFVIPQWLYRWALTPTPTPAAG